MTTDWRRPGRLARPGAQGCPLRPRLRKEAANRGLDPNKWFGNVELVAAQRIGRETVTYVANIYKYYVAYEMVLEHKERLAEVKKSVRRTDH